MVPAQQTRTGMDSDSLCLSGCQGWGPGSRPLSAPSRLCALAVSAPSEASFLPCERPLRMEQGFTCFRWQQQNLLF